MGEVSVKANLRALSEQVMPELKPVPPMTQTDSIFMNLTERLAAMPRAGNYKSAAGAWLFGA